MDRSLRCPVPQEPCQVRHDGLKSLRVENGRSKRLSPDLLRVALGACGTRKNQTSLLQPLNSLLIVGRSRISSAQGRKAGTNTVGSKQRNTLNCAHPGCPCCGRQIDSSSLVFSTGPFLFFLCLTQLFPSLGYGITLNFLSALGLHTK